MSVFGILSRRAAMVMAAGVALATAVPVSGALAEDTVINFGRAPVATYEALIMANEFGWFQEAGLDVRLTIGSAPDQDLARVVAGELDLSMTTTTAVIAAIANGLPVKAVINTQNHDEPPTIGLLVMADSPYQTLSDLKGKKIGMFGTSGAEAIMLLRQMEAEGMQQGDIEFANLPFDAHIESLLNGNVDAVVPLGPFYQMASVDAKFRKIEDGFDKIRGMPALLVVASDETISKKGEALKKLVDVVARAYAYANEHPEEVRRVDHETSNFPDAYLDNRPIPPAVPVINRDVLADIAKDMVRWGFSPKELTADDLIWDGAPK